jgi:hypothetical protein
MSKGVSWRQRLILQSLLRREEADKKEYGHAEPVAWKDLDYGPWHEGSYKHGDEPRQEWNREQALRRALRSLEKRGLVDLGQYVFTPFPEPYVTPHPHHFLDARIKWMAMNPDQHIPGKMRIMTGVLLTEEGRRIAKLIE